MQLIDLQRPHPITAPPLLSPPAWLACASPRPWGPGIRLESRFQECHLPLLMVLIIGTGWRAGSGGAEADSLLRLPPQRCSTREAGRSWHRAGAGAGAAEAAAEFHNVRLALPLSAAFMQAGLWRRARGRVVMGSEDAKSGRGGGRWRGLGGKWEVPAPRFATLYQAKSLPVWDPKPPVADQKGRSLLSYLLSEQNSAGGRSPHPPAQRNLAEPPLRGHKSCWELGQRKFLEAFTAPVPPPPLLPPLSSAVTTSLLRPLRHQPP